jgi:hypothetical protein
MGNRLRTLVLGLVGALAFAAATAAAAATGGPYTTPSGATVQVLASDAYPADDVRNQTWADFLDSLLHGDELSSVTLFLAPPLELRETCGRAALACYSTFRRTIVFSPEDSIEGPSARSVLAHEYGHHVAASRLNTPWTAVDWGPKRWASAAGVCKREQDGTAFPGDERENYRLNPGEAFAEAYRVANERRLGLPEAPWGTVAGSWYPDEDDLRAVEEDVLTPWTANERAVFTSTLRPGKSRYRFTVATPNDGVMQLTLRAPRTGIFELRLYDRGSLIATTRRTTRLTVCGERSFLASVVRLQGDGTFTVDVSRP